MSAKARHSAAKRTPAQPGVGERPAVAADAEPVATPRDEWVGRSPPDGLRRARTARRARAARRGGNASRAARYAGRISGGSPSIVGCCSISLPPHTTDERGPALQPAQHCGELGRRAAASASSSSGGSRSANISVLPDQHAELVAQVPERGRLVDGRAGHAHHVAARRRGPSQRSTQLGRVVGRGATASSGHPHRAAREHRDPVDATDETRPVGVVELARVRNPTRASACTTPSTLRSVHVVQRLVAVGVRATTARRRGSATASASRPALPVTPASSRDVADAHARRRPRPPRAPSTTPRQHVRPAAVARGRRSVARTTYGDAPAARSATRRHGPTGRKVRSERGHAAEERGAEPAQLLVGRRRVFASGRGALRRSSGASAAAPKHEIVLARGEAERRPHDRRGTSTCSRSMGAVHTRRRRRVARPSRRSRSAPAVPSTRSVRNHQSSASKSVTRAGGPPSWRRAAHRRRCRGRTAASQRSSTAASVVGVRGGAGAVGGDLPPVARVGRGVSPHARRRPRSMRGLPSGRPWRDEQRVEVDVAAASEAREPELHGLRRCRTRHEVRRRGVERRAGRGRRATRRGRRRARRSTPHWRSVPNA